MLKKPALAYMMGWLGWVASDTTNVCWNTDSAARSSSDTRGMAAALCCCCGLSSELVRAEPEEGRAETPWGRPVWWSVWRTRPHSAARCCATTLSSSLSGIARKGEADLGAAAAVRKEEADEGL
ncbi:Os11g0102301, partial [Oryza sativa Japonica Group]